MGELERKFHAVTGLSGDGDFHELLLVMAGWCVARRGHWSIWTERDKPGIACMRVSFVVAGYEFDVLCTARDFRELVLKTGIAAGVEHETRRRQFDN